MKMMLICFLIFPICKQELGVVKGDPPCIIPELTEVRGSPSLHSTGIEDRENSSLHAIGIIFPVVQVCGVLFEIFELGLLRYYLLIWKQTR
jgi:hypothetical protein